MFNGRSKFSFVKALLITAYAVCLIGSNTDTTSSAENAAKEIAIAEIPLETAFLMLHLAMASLSAFFCYLGFGLKANWGFLVSGILMCVAALCVPVYFMFTVPLLILAFVSYSKQKKINENNDPK